MVTFILPSLTILFQILVDFINQILPNYTYLDSTLLDLQNSHKINDFRNRFNSSFAFDFFQKIS